MKPMTLNLSKVKKIAGDNKSSTFLHEAGHKIIIAHDKLPALQKKQLEKMPVQKMADGGLPDALNPNPSSDPLTSVDLNKVPDVPDIRANNKERYNQIMQDLKENGPGLSDKDIQEGAANQLMQENQSQEDTRESNLPNAPGSDDLAQKQAALGVGPSLSQPTDSSQQTLDQSQVKSPQDQGPQQNPASPSGWYDDINGAFGQGQRAISEQQAIASKQAQGMQEFAKNDLEARQQNVLGYKQNLADFQDKQKMFLDRLANENIDPQQYVKSLSPGQVAGNAISLFLSGVGSGFSHQGNFAQETLNNAINRDMEAQKMKIGKDANLLDANRALFQDETMAQNATRINLNDLYDRKMQQVALGLGSQQAKAAADMVHAKFTLENAQLLQQNAMRGTVLHSLANGGQGLDPIDLGHAGIVPMEAAAKESGFVNAQKQNVARTKELLQEARKETSVGQLLNPQSNPRLHAIEAELINKIVDSDASHRITPESAKLEIQPYLFSTANSKGTFDQKAQGILSLMESKAKASQATPFTEKYIPTALPSYKLSGGSGQSQGASSYEGQIAEDKYGNRIVHKNGKWVPVGK